MKGVLVDFNILIAGVPKIHLISHQIQRTSLRGAKRRGNPDNSMHKGLLISWIAALRSQ